MLLAGFSALPAIAATPAAGVNPAAAYASEAATRSKTLASSANRATVLRLSAKRPAKPTQARTALSKDGAGALPRAPAKPDASPQGNADKPAVVPPRRKTALLPSSRLGRPGAAAAAAGKTEREQRFAAVSGATIGGEITLQHCPGGPNNVRVRVIGQGQTREVTGMRLPDDDLRLHYSVSGLPAGRYTVTPILAGVSCPGGTWQPRSATVTAGPRLTAMTQDFTYAIAVAENRISRSILTSAVRSVFDGTQIRLHNEGGNDSWVRLPAGLGGRVTRLDIPVYRDGARRYYVRDINLRSIDADVSGGLIRLGLHFEGNGIELKGECRGSVIECPVGRDDSAPDVHLGSVSVNAFLKPERFVNADSVDVSFGEVDIQIAMNAQVRGVPGLVPGFNAAVGREIRRALHRQLMAMIDQRSVRAAVARELRRALDPLGIGRIQAVRFEGNTLVIRHIPA
jgi:hypothetical protein